MRRGEIYRVHHPGRDAAGDDPKLYRSFVVVSRQVLLDSKFPTVICAPILTRGHGLSTQVSVGVDEGLKHESWFFGATLEIPPRCNSPASSDHWLAPRFTSWIERSKWLSHWIKPEPE